MPEVAAAAAAVASRLMRPAGGDSGKTEGAQWQGEKRMGQGFERGWWVGEADTQGCANWQLQLQKHFLSTCINIIKLDLCTG